MIEIDETIFQILLVLTSVGYGLLGYVLGKISSRKKEVKA
jgi:hypothetical protein